MMNWLLGLFVFFFRKAKKPRFLPMVRSVGRKGGRCTWARTVWQQELQLHNRFPVNCFVYRFWRAAFWVTLPLPSQARRAVCRQGISMCPSDFPLVERREGAVAETCWLLSTQIIQTAEERNALFCKLAFPTGRKQRPNVLKEAAARCCSPWNLPAGYSHWDRRWRLLLSIRPGDVRRNGWEHAFTSCSRHPSV